MKIRKKLAGWLLAAAVCAALSGCFGMSEIETLPGESGQEAPAEKPSETSVRETTGPEKVAVYVCGGVRTPDVYELDPGSRVKDAVLAAGGLTEDADGNGVNLAAPVQDGEQVYIPLRGESAAAAPVPAGDGRVNINTASEKELQTLTGIGEARAKDIIAYRQEHGAFASIEEIKNVPGIKEAAFAKIKDHITV